MLIHCPRCGFQQPKDKYCARCGVDMENYRPPRKSRLQRILGNPAVQVGAVLVVAAFVGLGLYQRKQRDLEDRVSYLKSGVQVARSVAGPTQTPDDLSDQQPVALSGDDAAMPESLAPQPGDGADAAATTGRSSSPTEDSLKATAAGAETVPKPQGITLVRVTFAEISEAALQEVWEASRSAGQFNSLGDHFAGIVPDIGKRLVAANRGLKILSREERAIAPGAPVQFFQGVRPGDPENEIGFTSYIELQEIEGTLFRASFDLMRSWKEGPALPAGPSQRRLFPAVFELAKGSGFFMSGIIPHGSPLENSEELVNVSPFQILRSGAFRARASDSIVFVEFESR